MRARALALALACATPALAGCGGGSDEPTTFREQSPSSVSKLTGEEERLVERSERTITLYCKKRARALTDPSRRPTVGEQARALEAVDALAGLAGAKPGAELRPGLDVRTYLGDIAENLEGANCDPQIIDRIDLGLAETAPGP